MLTVSVLGTPSWVEQGPGPITNGNNVIIPANTQGPQAGATNDVAVDPSNPNHVFVGTVDGGIWRTNDFEDANPFWVPLTDNLPGLAMVDIKFDPLDPTGNTLYAGSGNISNDLGDSNPVLGVLKTTDNGNHWVQLGESIFNGVTINRIVPTSVIDSGVGPGRGGQIVLAGTSSGDYQSDDAGVTWNLISGANGLPSGFVIDLQADSANNSRFYTALPAQFGANSVVTRNGGVFRGAVGANGTITWTNVSAGITGINNAVTVLIAVHNDAANNVVNVATVDPTVVGGKVTATPFAGVSRSTNQGGNWTLVGGALPNTNPGQQTENFSFVADPVDPNITFVSGDRDGTGTNNAGNIFRVDAGANSYTSVANGGAGNTAPHPDSRFMIFDTSGPNRILIETDDGGIYRLVNPNGGGARAWNSADGNIRPTEFFAVAYDTINNEIFGGSQDNSTPEQTAPGSFTWKDNTGGDGEEVGVDNTSNPNHSIRYTNDQNLGNFRKETYDNTGTLVNTTNPGLVVNGTGGQTIFQVEANANPGGTAPFLPFFTPWVLNGADPTRIMFGSSNFLYESTDQGSTLTALGGVTNLGGGNFKPSSPVGAIGPIVGSDPIAYGGFSGGVANTAVLWVGTGANLRLRTSGTGLPAVVANYTGSAVIAIVMDPTDWHTAYVLDNSGKVFKAVTNDSGSTVTFTNLTGNLPGDPVLFRSIEFVRSGGTQVLLVGGQQIYRAINPGVGANWTVFGQGLPNANVRDLHYIPQSDILLAGTDGRGAWTVNNAAAALVSVTGSEVLVCGDENTPDENDAFRLVRDPIFPTMLDVYVNGVLEQVVPLAGIQHIQIYGGGGFNTLTVDSSNGVINVPNGITFNAGDPCPTTAVADGAVDPPMGQDGTGALILTQTGGPTINTDVYSPGPIPGNGTDVITDSNGNVQSIYFTELTPTYDSVPATTLTVNGTNADNAINYMEGNDTTGNPNVAWGQVSVDNQEAMNFTNKVNLVINSLAGNDFVNLNDPANNPTALTSITVNAGDGYDGVTTHGGVNGLALTFNGGAGIDTLDASGVTGATSTVTINGTNGTDTMIGSTATGVNNTFHGGTGADTILLKGTSGNDHISVAQTAVGAYTSNVNGITHNDTFTNIKEFKLDGGDGNDVLFVTPGDNLASNLHFTVDGGTGFDELAIGDAGTGDLLLYRKGATADSGSITVGPANASPVTVDFTGIDFVNPIPAAGGRVVVFPFDVFEPNNFPANAFDLGAPTTTTINANIDPGPDATFGLPGDVDWYKVEANVTGTLDLQLFFSELATVASGRPGLPGAGNLDLNVFDAAGDLISSSTTTTSNERVRIPVVQGQAYFAEIVGVGTAINGFSLTVINTAPPTPYDLELSRSVPNGEPAAPLPPAGTPDTGDLPPSAPPSDTGRSQFDNVTDINKPTIYIRLNDAILLNDLPGNGVPNLPPKGVIPIPFSATGATAGFRVAVFDGNNSSTPVGFAVPVAGFPGVYRFDFTTALADGVHHLVARIQMVDGATPKETGFGDASGSLDITIDTVPPPVMFGTGTSSGLVSDTGVIPEPETFIDLITSTTVPTFQGLAEANSVVRLYAAITNPANPNFSAVPVFPNNFVAIGETVAIPEDGTNAFPNGMWTLKSTVDLNNPTFFLQDGLRTIVVTAEDLAGNVSGPAPGSTVLPPAQTLPIFLDTSGPQVTSVVISDPSVPPAGTNGENLNYNIFSEKTANNLQGPTPLVYALTVNLQDLPARVAQFLYNAIKLPVVEGQPNGNGTFADGGLTLTGDANGRIAFQVVANNDAPTAGNPATAEVQLRFVDANGNPIALPDDRYTLTIDDTAIVDPVGNLLDGESNAAEPLDVPTFPSGNGVPGGNFVARFTVDSRPELGAYAASRIYEDTNGNFVYDPQNPDATNRDLTLTLQIAPSLVGVVSPMGVHDAVFTGDFANSATATPILANGFNEFASFGFDPLVNGGKGGFRWLIDVNGDGVIDPAKGDIAYAMPTGFKTTGIALAGNFQGDTPAMFQVDGDELALFNAGTYSFFKIDYTQINPQTGTPGIIVPINTVTTSLRGYPIVGDFNGDGVTDLATWQNDVFQFNFGMQPGGAGTPVVYTGNVDTTINFGFPGVGEIPVAADMNQDGITDVGLWVPGRAGTVPQDTAEWLFLMSNDADIPGVGRQLALPPTVMSAADVPASVAFLNAELNHPFSPGPLGNDLYAQIFDEFANPIVGNWDPPLSASLLSSSTDTTAPTSTVSALAASESSASFTVSWTGQDNPGGSGIAGYNVYVSDNGGAYSAWLTSASSASATFNGQNGHTYGFFSVATDKAGNVQATPASAEATTTVQVHTSTTTSLATSSASIVPGQTVTFTATVSAGAGIAAPTGNVIFKNGATVLATVALQGGVATFSTAAFGLGGHSITANYGGLGQILASAAGPLVESVMTAALEFDPYTAGATALYVGGTAGADVITFSPANAHGGVNATIKNAATKNKTVSLGTFTPTGHIIAYGVAGNDTIQSTTSAINGKTYSITIAEMFFGGVGSSTLIGGNGPDLLVGGSGNNTLIGGLGNNVLIGGGGSNKLYSRPAGQSTNNNTGSLMIGGTTIYNGQEAVLESILEQWNAPLDYNTRIANLTSGNNRFHVTLNSTTVLPESSVDQLFSSGLDWLWNVSGKSKMSGRKPGTRVN